jgi:hypothetical protein
VPESAQVWARGMARDLAPDLAAEVAVVFIVRAAKYRRRA